MLVPAKRAPLMSSKHRWGLSAHLCLFLLLFEEQVGICKMLFKNGVSEELTVCNLKIGF